MRLMRLVELGIGTSGAVIISDLCLPSSPRNSIPSPMMTPMVSTNEYDDVSGSYLSVFLTAAATAAAM